MLAGMMVAYTRIWVILLACLVIWLAAGCSRGRAIRIAVVGPMTGPRSKLGENQANAARMAVDEVNSHGGLLGREVHLLVLDDRADPALSVNIAKELCADPEIVGVVGPATSSTALAAASIYNDAGLVTVAASVTNPRLTRREHRNVIRLCLSDDVQGPAMADFAVDGLEKRRFAVLHDGSTYGKSTAEAFRNRIVSRKLEIVAYEQAYLEPEVERRLLLKRLADTRPDAVYFGGIFIEADLLVWQLRHARIGATLLGPDGLFTPDFIALGGEATEGSYVSFTSPPWITLRSASGFISGYEHRYGRMGSYAPLAYDSAKILIDAVSKAAKADRKAVESVLRRPDYVYKGVTGKIRFDSRGDTIGRRPSIYVVKHGAFQLVQ